MRRIAAVSVVLIFFLSPSNAIADPNPPGADPPCYEFSCTTNQAGIDTSTSRADIANLPLIPGDKGGAPVDPAYNGPRYEYSSTTACTAQPPGSPGADTLCAGAVTSCSNPTNGAGPLTRIWRRTVQPTGAVSGWEQIGVTCWADVAPGGKPRVTMAMIIDAFRHTPWAKTQVTTQPAGNVTLVGLDTYYQVNWSVAGYQPGEVDTVDLLGYAVQIRPKLDHFTYLFGDGETFGPTTYLGGVYPTGTITHRYHAAGINSARVNTTLGADFRINESNWAPIPDQVTVQGPPTTVTVRTATARLVTH